MKTDFIIHNPNTEEETIRMVSSFLLLANMPYVTSVVKRELEVSSELEKKEVE